MADFREPPPLFEEESRDSKDIEEDDDIFQIDKKMTATVAGFEAKDDMFEDINDEVSLGTETVQKRNLHEEKLSENTSCGSENMEKEVKLFEDTSQRSESVETGKQYEKKLTAFDSFDLLKPVNDVSQSNDDDVGLSTTLNTSEKNISLQPDLNFSKHAIDESTKSISVSQGISDSQGSIRFGEASKVSIPGGEVGDYHGEAPKVSVSESSTAYASANKMPFGFHSTNKQESLQNEKCTERTEEENKYSIEITITDPKKVGDGMNAYMTYKICTRTTIPDFRQREMEVYRRFSDFLGLRDKLAEKHLQHGIIIPPPPEKSIIAMAKTKVSKEESGSMDFVEQRRAALERFLNRVACHPILQTDPNFVDFLEMEGELPKATNTSALSGAGVLRFFNRFGDSIGKMTYKMDETDQWFEEKSQQIEILDLQLKKLHTSVECLVTGRKELAVNTGTFAKSLALVSSVEEQSGISRALSQLAEVEENLDLIHEEQTDNDFFLFAEFIKDYIGIVQSVKEVFYERIKFYKIWKDNEVNLAKRREIKVRMELAHKLDKINDASREISEWEQQVDKSQQDFERISKNIHKEMIRFERQKCKDFRDIILAYLESLLKNEQQLIQHWETFLPEAKLIA